MTGEEIHRLISELYPVCRSITGDGLRRTLRRVAEEIPLELHEVASGTPVLDWTVPDEWNIRGASIDGPDGRRIVDFQDHNLHVVSYSVPVEAEMSLDELRPHLHSLPDRPDLIPYRTSYYERDWGFCLPHRRLEALSEGTYRVHIDSTLRPGALSYGELFIPGTEDGEVLVSVHCCHPSLADDNLSGIGVAVALARSLLDRRHRLGFRFLFVPGTIGSITWLARNRTTLERIRHGLVMTCVGDELPFTYKRSRRGDAGIDRAMAHALSTRPGAEAVDFTPYGYDERQYCSPGFDLPVGCLMRGRHGRFPEYHTSADDLGFIRPERLRETVDLCLEVFGILEADRRYLNRAPYGEPQLGRRGLYDALGGESPGTTSLAALWVLNLSDGEHSLLDVAERSDLPLPVLDRAAAALRSVGLLEELPDRGTNAAD
jgi:aminopeptidase-like protein